MGAITGMYSEPTSKSMIRAIQCIHIAHVSQIHGRRAIGLRFELHGPGSTRSASFP